MKKDKVMDDRKGNKIQRIKIYFIDATKEVIINEGVENVTLRKVAAIAGCSYATIYNYFKDLNELLWAAKETMSRDFMEYIQKEMYSSSFDVDEIKRLFRIYAAYYFRKPQIFSFYYFYKINKPIMGAVPAEPKIKLEDMWQEILIGFIGAGTIQGKDVEVIAKALIYSVHGMITLYFSNHGELTEENVYLDLEIIVNRLLLIGGVKIV